MYLSASNAAAQRFVPVEHFHDVDRGGEIFHGRGLALIARRCGDRRGIRRCTSAASVKEDDDEQTTDEPGEAVLRQRHRRVLLAEDDFEMRRLLSRVLRRAGFDLVEAASGDEALDRIADQLLENDVVEGMPHSI